MAELLIVVVVIAGVVLLYAADRARKLRAHARQMAAMNDRLDVAAAKVDEQQERQQARVRASAELTSVMPAIKRPPLTLPGVPGPAAEPDEEDEEAEPELVDREAKPVACAPPDTPTAEAGPGAADSPAAEAVRDAGASPAVADEAAPEPERTPEGTLTVAGGVIPDAAPVLKLRVTSEGTLIMPAVPGPAPAPAGTGESARASEAVPPAEAVAAPAPPRDQAAASQRRADRA